MYVKFLIGREKTSSATLYRRIVFENEAHSSLDRIKIKCLNLHAGGGDVDLVNCVPHLALQLLTSNRVIRLKRETFYACEKRS